jgi:dTDP-4-amino-4,6-dideoxygalactose transaminase
MSAQSNLPILDLQPQTDLLWEELQAAFQRVLRSGHFVMGPEVRAFEEEVGAYLGSGHAIALNSGTDALFIALRAMGLGPGDEVITTPFTFFATAEAISHVGATPVFVDIEEGSMNLDPELLEQAITPRTKAIIPVHLFGRPCAMDRILAIAAAHGLAVVEDCAQSFGSAVGGFKTGTLGLLGCFSFFPTKNLSAFGDGGMLITGDADLAETARMLRSHGSRKKYHNEAVGYNSRLDELQAAFLRVKLPHIDRWNEERRRGARQYDRLLAGIPGLVTPSLAPEHVFHQYTVRILGGYRDAVQQALADAGIGTMVYYPVPVHRLKLYQESHAGTVCPWAERCAGEVLSLPMWPELAASGQQGRVAEALRRALTCRQSP